LILQKSLSQNEALTSAGFIRNRQKYQVESKTCRSHLPGFGGSRSAEKEMALGDLQVSNETGRSTLIKIAQLDLQAAYKEWLWIWDYYMILICLSFHNPSWQPWVTVKLTCSVVMLTWSYSTSWKLGHRTYNQYLFTEHTTIIHGKKNNHPYRVSVLKMKSFQTQAH